MNLKFETWKKEQYALGRLEGFAEVLAEDLAKQRILSISLVLAQRDNVGWITTEDAEEVARTYLGATDEEIAAAKEKMLEKDQVANNTCL